MQDEKRVSKSIRDQEAHLAFMNEESKRIALIVTELERQAECSRIEIQRHQKLKEASILLEQEIVSSKIEIEQLTHSKVEIKNEISQSAKSLEFEKKERLKELQKINHWILEAGVEKTSLEKVLNDLREVLSENKDALETLIELKKELHEHQLLVAKARTDLELIQETADITRQEELDSISQYESDLEIIETRATDAEAKLRSFTEEYERKKSDLDVYAARITEEYEKVFPDRKVKLE